jgi:hypothetical protein
MPNPEPQTVTQGEVQAKTESMIFRPLICLDNPPQKIGGQGKSKGLKTIDLVLT